MMRWRHEDGVKQLPVLCFAYGKTISESRFFDSFSTSFDSRRKKHNANYNDNHHIHDDTWITRMTDWLQRRVDCEHFLWRSEDLFSDKITRSTRRRHPESDWENKKRLRPRLLSLQSAVIRLVLAVKNENQVILTLHVYNNLFEIRKMTKQISRRYPSAAHNGVNASDKFIPLLNAMTTTLYPHTCYPVTQCTLCTDSWLLLLL